MKNKHHQHRSILPNEKIKQHRLLDINQVHQALLQPVHVVQVHYPSKKKKVID